MRTVLVLCDLTMHRLKRITARRSLEIELVRQPIRPVRVSFVRARVMFFGRGGKNLSTPWNSAWRARINLPERRASARRPDRARARVDKSGIIALKVSRAGPAIVIYVYLGEEVTGNEFVSLPGYRRKKERTTPRGMKHTITSSQKRLLNVRC